MLLQYLIISVCSIKCLGHQNFWRPLRQHYIHRTPQEIMVDVVNNLALKLLAIHNEGNENNIAISPYGVTSVLVALKEGVRGYAVDEITQASGLPSDLYAVRIGLRDIHRHLKSYFIPEEGFLSGLTLSHVNVTLLREYEHILKFYGFDVNSFNNALFPVPTSTPAIHNDFPDTTIGPSNDPSTETTTTSTNLDTETTTITTPPAAGTVPSTETTRTVAPSTETTVPETTTSLVARTDQSTETTTPVAASTDSNGETTRSVAPSTETTIPETTTPLAVSTESSAETTRTVAPSTETTTPLAASTDLSPETTRTVAPSIETTIPETTTPLAASTDSSAETTTTVAPSTETTIPETTTTVVSSTTTVDSTSPSVEMTTNQVSSAETVSTIVVEETTTSFLDGVSTVSENEEMQSTTEMSTTESVDPTTMEFAKLVSNNNASRVTRSAVDYIIARYYDGHAAIQRPPPYFNNEQYFWVNGNNKQTNINYMTYDTVLPFHYIPHLKTSALRFPLDSAKYYLLLLLPENPTEIDKLIYELGMQSINIKYVINNLRYTHVKASIPSFMLKGYVVLTSTFQKMGIQRVFEPQQADFSLMTNDRNIYVANVEQAITVNIRNYVDPASMNSGRILHRTNPVVFNANHPFLYFVIDSEINVILMEGKILNPLNSRIK